MRGASSDDAEDALESGLPAQSFSQASPVPAENPAPLLCQRNSSARSVLDGEVSPAVSKGDAFRPSRSLLQWRRLHRRNDCGLGVRHVR